MTDRAGPATHQHHALRKQNGLSQVVRDEQDRGARLLPDPQQLCRNTSRVWASSAPNGSSIKINRGS